MRCGVRSRGGATVEGEPDGHATLVIQAAGWTGLVRWHRVAHSTVQIFIDDKCVGVLSDRRPRSLPVTAGVHEVAARCARLWSRTLTLSVAAGDRARLECGYNRAGHLCYSLALGVMQ